MRRSSRIKGNALTTVITLLTLSRVIHARSIRFLTPQVLASPQKAHQPGVLILGTDDADTPRTCVNMHFDAYICLPACRMAAACGSMMNILSHCGFVFFSSPLSCGGLADHFTRTGSIQARNKSIHDACTCMHHHPHTYVNCRFCHRFEVEGITLPQDGSVGLVVNGVLFRVPAALSRALHACLVDSAILASVRMHVELSYVHMSGISYLPITRPLVLRPSAWYLG